MLFLILFALLFVGNPSEAQSPSHRETITRTLEFSQASADNLLLLKNISGDVKIEGYEGTEIKITVEKTIEARNQEDLQRGVEEIQLATQQEGNTMMVYMDAPFVFFQWKQGHAHYHVDRDDDDYQYRMDFTLQVPRQLNLEVSTVNGGIVEVEKVQSQRIEVANVNGGIRCTEISGQTKATTVNGDVDIEYAQAPTTDSRFKTINGDITLLIPENLSADVTFKSMNGDFYTNFEELNYLPAEVETQEDQSGKRTTFRIDQTTKLRIGKGGPLYEMETLNGEVYLKHQ